jgi:protein-S-isoprenylcysteine O-methyltransferase Ste14
MRIPGFILVFIFVAAYGALHSLLASNRAKQAFKRRFGDSNYRFYRLLYNVVGALTFIPVLAVLALDPGQTLYRLSWPWTLIAFAGQALAILLLFLGLLQTDAIWFLGFRQLAQPGAQESDALEVRGLYCRVRHPLYSAGLLFIWLTPIMTTSILALNISLTLYILIGSIFEERRLVGHFGQAYVDYQNHVPRLIPRPGRCYAPDQTGHESSA